MSNLKDELRKLAEYFESSKNAVQTEAQTKQSFIIPFIDKVLGYSPYDINQVELEVIAGPGSKKEEKVDIGLKKEGKIVVIIEAKHWTEKLDAHLNQLIRYFAFTKAKFAILTNGYNYRFYADIEDINKMDEQPFLEFDIDKISNVQIKELERFRIENFDERTILDNAEKQKIELQVRKVIKEEFSTPSKELVQMLLKKIYEEGKRLTEKRKAEYEEIIRDGAASIIKEMALELTTKTQSEIIKKSEKTDIIKPLIDIQSKDSSVITTDEELLLYNMVRAIGGQVCAVDEIIQKDTSNYFAIMFQNQRQTFLRFYSKKSTVDIIFKDGIYPTETFSLEKTEDIYKYGVEICQAIGSFKK
jgi:hypothetical protein